MLPPQTRRLPVLAGLLGWTLRAVFGYSEEPVWTICGSLVPARDFGLGLSKLEHTTRAGRLRNDRHSSSHKYAWR